MYEHYSKASPDKQRKGSRFHTSSRSLRKLREFTKLDLQLLTPSQLDLMGISSSAATLLFDPASHTNSFESAWKNTGLEPHSHLLELWVKIGRPIFWGSQMLLSAEGDWCIRLPWDVKIASQAALHSHQLNYVTTTKQEAHGDWLTFLASCPRKSKNHICRVPINTPIDLFWGAHRYLDHVDISQFSRPSYASYGFSRATFVKLQERFRSAAPGPLELSFSNQTKLDQLRACVFWKDVCVYNVASTNYDLAKLSWRQVSTVLKLSYRIWERLHDLKSGHSWSDVLLQTGFCFTKKMQKHLEDTGKDLYWHDELVFDATAVRMLFPRAIVNLRSFSHLTLQQISQLLKFDPARSAWWTRAAEGQFKNDNWNAALRSNHFRALDPPTVSRCLKNQIELRWGEEVICTGYEMVAPSLSLNLHRTAPARIKTITHIPPAVAKVLMSDAVPDLAAALVHLQSIPWDKWAKLLARWKRLRLDLYVNEEALFVNGTLFDPDFRKTEDLSEFTGAQLKSRFLLSEAAAARVVSKAQCTFRDIMAATDFCITDTILKKWRSLATGIVWNGNLIFDGHDILTPSAVVELTEMSKELLVDHIGLPSNVAEEIHRSKQILTIRGLFQAGLRLTSDLKEKWTNRKWEITLRGHTLFQKGKREKTTYDNEWKLEDIPHSSLKSHLKVHDKWLELLNKYPTLSAEDLFHVHGCFVSSDMCKRWRRYQMTVYLNGTLLCASGRLVPVERRLDLCLLSPDQMCDLLGFSKSQSDAVSKSLSCPTPSSNTLRYCVPLHVSTEQWKQWKSRGFTLHIGDTDILSSQKSLDEWNTYNIPAVPVNDVSCVGISADNCDLRRLTAITNQGKLTRAHFHNVFAKATLQYWYRHKLSVFSGEICLCKKGIARVHASIMFPGQIVELLGVSKADLMTIEKSGKKRRLFFKAVESSTGPLTVETIDTLWNLKPLQLRKWRERSILVTLNGEPLEQLWRSNHCKIDILSTTAEVLTESRCLLRKVAKTIWALHSISGGAFTFMDLLDCGLKPDQGWLDKCDKHKTAFYIGDQSVRDLASQYDLDFETLAPPLFAGTGAGHFLQSLLDKPNCVCRCCERMLYRSQVRQVDHGHPFWQHVKDVNKKDMAEIEESIRPPDFEYDSDYVCLTCHGKYNKNTMPQIAAINGLRSKKIPAVLGVLTAMERRVISRIICFQTIYAIRRSGQRCAQGSAISFWSDPKKILDQLPRHASEAGIVQVEVELPCDEESDDSSASSVGTAEESPSAKPLQFTDPGPGYTTV